MAVFYTEYEHVQPIGGHICVAAYGRLLHTNQKRVRYSLISHGVTCSW
jgi:hypothetical protein